MSRRTTPPNIVRGARVLITGAAHGMGALYARRAAREGAAAIALWDRDTAATEALAAELSSRATDTSGRATEPSIRTTDTSSHITEPDGRPSPAPSVRAITVDVSRREEIADAAATTRRFLGTPTILINNAGIVRSRTFWEHDPDADIEQTMRINTLAPMWVTREFLPDMLTATHESHRILTIASAAGLMSNPNMSVYAASKWAAVGWSDSLRLELERAGHRHVAVTTFCPSYVSTGMFAGARGPLGTPIMTPEQAVDAAWTGMLSARPMVLRPWSVKAAMAARGILPTRAWDLIADRLLRVYSSMDHFIGHGAGHALSSTQTSTEPSSESNTESSTETGTDSSTETGAIPPSASVDPT